MNGLAEAVQGEEGNHLRVGHRSHHEVAEDKRFNRGASSGSRAGREVRTQAKGSLSPHPRASGASVSRRRHERCIGYCSTLSKKDANPSDRKSPMLRFGNPKRTYRRESERVDIAESRCGLGGFAQMY